MTYKIFFLALGVFWATHKVVAQDTLRFGRVRLGDAATDTLFISNARMVDLMLSNPHITAPVFKLAPEAFSGVSKDLSPGETLGLPVSFVPTAHEVVSAQLDIDSGDGVLHWALEGEGVDAVIVINEVLADPPSGATGDANQDGVRSSSADEFVELVNTGNYPLEISGWQLSDRKTSANKRFTFPTDTWINPGEYIVLFGGGSASGLDGQVFIDDGKIGGGLSNSNDAVFLINPTTEDTLAQVEWTSRGSKDQSLVRFPEGIGEIELHTAFPGNGSRFSPGSARVVLSDLNLSPPETTLALGEMVEVLVQGVYSDGTWADVEDRLEWAVSDSTRLLGIGSRSWQAQSPGTVVLRAQATHVVREMQITITPPEIVGIEIVQGDTTLLLAEEMPLGLIGTLGDQSQYAITDNVVWTSVPASGAILSSKVASFSSPGTYNLIAQHKNWADTMAVGVFARGDLNADGAIDLVDAVRLVHLILGIDPEGQSFELRSADLDENNKIDIRDLVGVIGCFNKVSGGVSKPAIAVEGAWWFDDGALMMQTNVPVMGVVGKILGEITLNEGEGQYLCAQVNEDESVQFVHMSLGSSGISGAITAHAVGHFSGQIEDLKVVTFGGATYVLPQRASDLHTNRILSSFPNPFNPDTVIEYEINQPASVSLSIYSVSGQEVALLFNKPLDVGVYRTRWNGRGADGRKVASGVYFARLWGNGFESINKMVLMR